jgi:hypothetical protein
LFKRDREARMGKSHATTYAQSERPDCKSRGVQHAASVCGERGGEETYDTSGGSGPRMWGQLRDGYMDCKRLGRRGAGPIGSAFAGGSCRDAIGSSGSRKWTHFSPLTGLQISGGKARDWVSVDCAPKASSSRAMDTSSPDKVEPDRGEDSPEEHKGRS